jgi:hypothetical protein
MFLLLGWETIPGRNAAAVKNSGLINTVPANVYGAGVIVDRVKVDLLRFAGAGLGGSRQSLGNRQIGCEPGWRLQAFQAVEQGASTLPDF